MLLFSTRGDEKSLPHMYGEWSGVGRGVSPPVGLAYWSRVLLTTMPNLDFFILQPCCNRDFMVQEMRSIGAWIFSKEINEANIHQRACGIQP